MAVRLTRVACPGRASALVAVLALVAVQGCARKEAENAPVASPEAIGAPATPAASDRGPSEATEGAVPPGAVSEAAAPPTTPPPAMQPPPPPPVPVPVIDEKPAAVTPDRAPTTGKRPVSSRPQQGRGQDQIAGAQGPARPPATLDQDRDAPEPAPVEPSAPSEGDQAATPAERDPRDDIEAFYTGLPEEAIAFHVPRTVLRNQVFTVRLIVEPGKSEAELARVLIEQAPDAGPGEVRTRTARVGDEMQALLSSPTLQIVVRGTDTQLVRRSGVTEWVWDVTATTGGTHRLALTLYAIPQGRGSGLKVKTFEEKLSVEVAFMDEVKETLAANWEWMWTFVLGPVGAVLWRRRQQRRARAS